MNITRENIAEEIVKSLSANKDQLKRQFELHRNQIAYFFLDDLLPTEWVDKIHARFPKKEKMMQKKSIREHKYVAAQMDQYDPILEETIFAFQDHKVVALIEDICQLKKLHPDTHLYAGGISLMAEANFLNPHLDNSHDKDRNRWRALNLLFYVTPHWKKEYGGNLELWPEGLDKEQITLTSKFNRLVVMATHGRSWHSVSPVTTNGARQCISNYYFSSSPLDENDAFHVTSFRGRPEQKLRDKVLKADAALRMGVRKIFKKGIKENPHVYKKDEPKQ